MPLGWVALKPGQTPEDNNNDINTEAAAAAAVVEKESRDSDEDTVIVTKKPFAYNNTDNDNITNDIITPTTDSNTTSNTTSKDEFQPSATFQGFRLGFVYKIGEYGVGYYKDHQAQSQEQKVGSHQDKDHIMERALETLDEERRKRAKFSTSMKQTSGSVSVDSGNNNNNNNISSSNANDNSNNSDSEEFKKANNQESNNWSLPWTGISVATTIVLGAFLWYKLKK